LDERNQSNFKRKKRISGNLKDMQNKKKVSTSDKFEGNPRQITEKQLSLLKEHLEELGDLSGVIYCHNNKSYVGGNQRSEVFNGANISIVEKYDKPTKNKTVAHGFIEYNGEKYAYREVMFTEDEFRKACIVANNDGGSFDWDILANSWDAGELEDWGVDIPEEWGVEDKSEAEEDDYEIPDEIETDIVIGDLFEIGEHRLLCGDSTDSDAVAKLMGGEKDVLVFADPPYGIDIVKTNSSKVGGDGLTKFGKVCGGNYVEAKTYSQIIGDETTETAKDFYYTCIAMGFKNFIIWGGNYFTDFLPPSSCWIIWDKENTGNFADVELAWTSFKKSAKLYKWLWNGMSRKGSREIEGKTRVHPTQKPVGLFNDIFKDFNFNSCFDGFLGSGSTMVAAHQLNRKCYGIEIDPKYCQAIIDRMKKLDPELKIKKNGIETNQ